MRIQTGLIHFGCVHTESGLSEIGFKPVWSLSTSRSGLNADSNRFEIIVWVETLSHVIERLSRVAHQEQVEDSCVYDG